METVGHKAFVNELIKRLTEPAKSRLKLYQISFLIYMDHILELVINKYMLFRVKLDKKKSDLALHRMSQSQLKLDIVSKENIHKSLVLVKKKATSSFGKIFFII